MPKTPKQIQPLVDPNPPETSERHVYFICTEMDSPPDSAPPNAVGWVKFEVPLDLGGETAYGEITYERLIDWSELKKYRMQPKERIARVYFRLWQVFGEDIQQMLVYLTLFYKLTDDDPDLTRLRLAINLYSHAENLAAARKAIKRLNP